MDDQRLGVPVLVQVKRVSEIVAAQAGPCQLRSAEDRVNSMRVSQANLKGC
jgi:hypothetical protein